MDPKKTKLNAKETAAMAELKEQAKAAMERRLNELFAARPHLPNLQPILPSLMEVVDLLLLQSLLKGQALAVATSRERMGRLEEQLKAAMMIAEDAIAARERIYGGKMPEDQPQRRADGNT